MSFSRSQIYLPNIRYMIKSDSAGPRSNIITNKFHLVVPVPGLQDIIHLYIDNTHGVSMCVFLSKITF